MSEHQQEPTGIALLKCECGSDVFRIIETADWLADIGVWEGNETIRLCAQCGKQIGCFTEDLKGISITGDDLRQYRSRPLPAPAPYLPISLDFQPICIDKPCIGQIDICPVDDECDSVEQCVAHAEWLRQNPDVAERNRKIVAQHDAAIARQAREEFIVQIEDKLPRYPSSLGDMYLLSDIQGLAPQQAGDP